MIKELILLASYSATDGTAVGTFFDTLHQMGFFSYLIPFLLLFAFVFGILTKLNLFKDNKVINGIIALAVGLIAIQVPIVSQFFSAIFPQLGMALAVILVIFIIAGLFLSDKVNWINYVLIGIAGIIIIVVLVQTAGTLGWPVAQWWINNWSMIVAVVIIVGLVIAIIIGTSKGSGGGGTPKAFEPMWARP